MYMCKYNNKTHHRHAHIAIHNYEQSLTVITDEQINPDWKKIRRIIFQYENMSSTMSTAWQDK